MIFYSTSGLYSVLKVAYKKKNHTFFKSSDDNDRLSN